MILRPGTLPADDRGLAYGDGCFETLRLAGGEAPLADYHCRRMAAAGRRLGIPLDEADWWQQLRTLAAEAPASEGVVKLILTRGSGGRGYHPPADARPRLLGQWHPRPVPPTRLVEQGLDIGLSSVRLAEQPHLAGIKHLNRLEQVEARREAAWRKLDDCLMLDASGRPLELSSMNLFLVIGAELWTPPVDRAGVEGVMRRFLCDRLAADAGLAVRERRFGMDRLRQADEVFACNSVVGVLPVRKLGLWRWPAGDITRRLREAVESVFRS